MTRSRTSPAARRRRRRRTTLGILVLVALVALVSVLTAHSLQAVSGPASRPRPAPVTLSPGPAAPAPLVLPAEAKVFIIGDSYTEGWGAEPLSKGFAHLVGKPLGWRVVRDGVGASGYTAAGDQNQGNYRQRLVVAPKGPFDLVILQGGSNDEKATRAELEQAVGATVTAVQQRYPDARVLLMGPVSPYGSASPSRGAVNSVLTHYARENSLPFVNPIGDRWFVRGDAENLVNPTKGHPNNAGYARMTALFIDDINRLSATRDPSPPGE